MRIIATLVFISLSVQTLGQTNTDKLIVDSLLYELKKASALQRHMENEAERLRYLLTAKEMALRSTELEDSTYQALVAIQAHNFWTKNRGNYGDVEIYQGLYNALMIFNDPLLKTLPATIEKLENKDYNKTIIMADRLCTRVSRNMFVEEWDRFASDLPYELTCNRTK